MSFTNKHKKIVAVTMVKNENDIIELFCRYTLSYSDLLLIVEDHSDDNTRQVIAAMIDDGLPIVLFDNMFGGYYQNRVMTWLAMRAFNDYDADLVLPLDADEFYITTNGSNVRDALDVLDNETEYEMKWRTYLFTKPAQFKQGTLFERFTQYRDPGMEIHGKVMVQRTHLIDEGYELFTGNHWLVPSESSPDHSKKLLSDIVVAHFPIRSIEQITAKVIVGWLNFMCLPEAETMAKHWSVMYKHIKDYGGLTTEQAERFSLYYSFANYPEEGSNADMAYKANIMNGAIPNIPEACLKFEGLILKNTYLSLITNYFEKKLAQSTSTEHAYGASVSVMNGIITEANVGIGRRDKIIHENINDILSLKEQLSQIKSELKKSDAQYKKIRHSKSYRVGHVITKIPRMIKGNIISGFKPNSTEESSPSNMTKDNVKGLVSTEIPGFYDEAMKNGRSQTSRPTVLGILLCYNDGDILEEQIEYLLSQHHDIIAWDHGSDDNTAQVLDKYNSIFVERKFIPRDFDFYNLYQAMSENLMNNYIEKWDMISWPDQDEFLEGPKRDKSYYEYLTDVWNSPYAYIAFDNYLYWFTKDSDKVNGILTNKMVHYSLFSQCSPRIRAWKAAATNVRLFNHNPCEGEKYPVNFKLRHYPFRSEEHFYRRLTKDRADLERDGSNYHYNAMRRNLNDILKITPSSFHVDNGIADLNPVEIFDWSVVYKK